LKILRKFRVNSVTSLSFSLYSLSLPPFSLLLLPCFPGAGPSRAEHSSACPHCAARTTPRCCLAAPRHHPHSSAHAALADSPLRRARHARRQPRPAERRGRCPSCPTPLPAPIPFSFTLLAHKSRGRPLLARHARREPWPPPPTATAAPRAITLSFPKPSTPARPPPPSDPPKPVRPSQSPPASRRRGTESRRPPASRGAPTSGLLLPQRSPGTGSSNPSEAHRPKPATPCPPERRCR